MSFEIIFSAVIAIATSIVVNILSSMINKILKKKKYIKIKVNETEFSFDINNIEAAKRVVYENMNAPQVYISYSHNDIDKAKHISDFLIKHNIRVWFDENNINVGDAITDRIKMAINESSYYLILISKNTKMSKWLNYEINIMLQNESKSGINRIIPILVDDADLPKILEYRNFIEFNENRNDNLNILLEKVT
ncbi:toll/interleukin-1 receptor domain-containing protein [Lutispora sp.]|uniref:toll/interleukin-1 receptor domain-containing protein n=1 Tax=Lutispora sp. TaxID=2828727 RepID=UPI00356934A7